MNPEIIRSVSKVIVICMLLLNAASCSQQTNPSIKNVSSPVDITTPSDEIAKPQSTSFECMMRQAIWGTFAKRGNAVSQTAIITWNSTEFGSEYTPEKRCDIVSKRLTNAVAHNGGKLGDLALSVGLLNNQSVVCFVTQATPKCNDTNLLFTLNRENANNAQSVLANIFNFAKAKGTTTNAQVYESGTFISLDLLVNRAFEQASSTPSPASPTTEQTKTW